MPPSKSIDGPSKFRLVFGVSPSHVYIRWVCDRAKLHVLAGSRHVWHVERSTEVSRTSACARAPRVQHEDECVSDLDSDPDNVSTNNTVVDNAAVEDLV